MASCRLLAAHSKGVRLQLFRRLSVVMTLASHESPHLLPQAPALGYSRNEAELSHSALHLRGPAWYVEIVVAKTIEQRIWQYLVRQHRPPPVQQSKHLKRQSHLQLGVRKEGKLHNILLSEPLAAAEDVAAGVDVLDADCTVVQGMIFVEDTLTRCVMVEVLPSGMRNVPVVNTKLPEQMKVIWRRSAGNLLYESSLYYLSSIIEFPSSTTRSVTIIIL